MLWWGLAVPPLLLLVVAVSVATGVGPARDALWPLPPLNASEAAALRDPAALVEVAGNGVDLDAAYPVQTRIFNRSDLRLTPLEAAAASARPDMTRLLFELGARPSAEELSRVFCIAAQANAAEVVSTLRERSGAHPPADCGRVPLPFPSDN